MSRRARSDPYPRLISSRDRSTPIGPNHTVPYGTVPFSYGYQAINCLATFTRSLRDKGSVNPVGTKSDKSLRDGTPSSVFNGQAYPC